MKTNDRWIWVLTCALLWTGQSAAQQEIYAVLGQMTGTITPTGEQLGTSVAAVGDLNGDGIQEFVAGAPQAGVILPGGTNSTSQTGRAKLFNGATGALLATYDGTFNGSFMGRTVVKLGDVNGDGVSDFAIGANQVALPPLPGGGPPTPPCYVRVCSGAIPGTYLYTLISPAGAPGDNFGQDLAAGDITGDGISDIVVGARTASRVYAYDGVTGALLLTIIGTASTQFGTVAVVGDQNGDGFRDILIGARLANNPSAVQTGAAFIASGQNGAILSTIYGQASADNFGSAVIALDDVDGDLIGDFAVGALRADFNGTDSGRVTAFAGGVYTILWSVDGSNATDFLGIGLFNGGDVDGDGLADVLAGGSQIDNGALSNCGGILVLSAVDGRELARIYGLATEDRIGTAMGDAGDVNLDGFPDILVGAGRNDTVVGVDTGRVSILTLGPALGPCAAGAVGVGSGGPFNVLSVNGSAGGALRRVDIPLNGAITVGVSQPPSNPNPAPFLVFGRFGVGQVFDYYELPIGLGTMCFIPSLVSPGDPALFLLFDSFNPANGGAIVPGATLTPYSFTSPIGVGFPVDFELQGIMFDTPSTLARTNAVIASIR